MPITQFSKPMFNDETLTEAQFRDAMNRFGADIDQVAADMEAGLSAMNLNDLNSASADSVFMALAQKTITVDTGRSYMPGHRITVARTSDPTKNMLSLVISYNPSTGQLVFLPLELSGAGTFSDWTITFAGAIPVMVDNELILTGNAGIGSTNTAIQRYTTVTKDTSGAHFTYNSSSTLGDSVTINTAGDYEVFRQGALTTAGVGLGVSLNSGGLTTSWSTRATSNPEEFVLGFFASSQTVPLSSSRIMRFEEGGILRPHNQASTAESTSGFPPIFAIKRLGFS